jgi:CDP-diacylglycerol--glycerol-3-phosphate 3-phosphatidyltransferase/cardiolipin synthase
VGDYDARHLIKVPGLLSLARLPLAALFPFTVEHPVWAVGVLGAGAATDILDGWYARRFGEETPTGALLDGVMDKVFVLGVAATLVTFGRLSLLETLLLGTRELGEVALLFYWAAVWRARRRPVRRAANRIGKLATAMQFSTVTAVLVGTSHRELWIIVTALCGAAAAVTYGVREGRACAKAGDPPHESPRRTRAP